MRGSVGLAFALLPHKREQYFPGCERSKLAFSLKDFPHCSQILSTNTAGAVPLGGLPIWERLWQRREQNLPLPSLILAGMEVK